jgi:hypothetical protein
MQQFLFIGLFNQLYMFRVIISPILRSTSTVYTAFGTMYRLQPTSDTSTVLPLGCIVGKSCIYRWSAPEDGRYYCLTHVELIKKTNKRKLLHLVGCLHRRIYLFIFFFLWKEKDTAVLIDFWLTRFCAIMDLSCKQWKDAQCFAWSCKFYTFMFSIPCIMDQFIKKYQQNVTSQYFISCFVNLYMFRTRSCWYFLIKFYVICNGIKS